MPEHQDPNFRFLLAGLLVTTIAGPLYQEFTGESLTLVTNAGFALTLIISLWTLANSRLFLLTGIALAGLEVLFTAIYAVRPSNLLEVLTILIMLAFCTISLSITLKEVLFDWKIDANRLIGAACAYLLLGLSIGLLNILLFKFRPDSFAGLGEDPLQTPGSELIYYSFVTMTTLGYGDITPEGPMARVLGYLAAITGQFYIAILVGTLVGMFLSQRLNGDDRPSE